MQTLPPRDVGEVLADIRARLDTLSPQCRKVALQVLDDPSMLGLCGIEDVASRCLVTPSSVFRFAQQLGFDGDRALRQTFRQALTRQLRRDERHWPAHPLRMGVAVS